MKTVSTAICVVLFASLSAAAHGQSLRTMGKRLDPTNRNSFPRSMGRAIDRARPFGTNSRRPEANSADTWAGEDQAQAQANAQAQARAQAAYQQRQWEQQRMAQQQQQYRMQQQALQQQQLQQARMRQLQEARQYQKLQERQQIFDAIGGLINGITNGFQPSGYSQPQGYYYPQQW